MSVYADFRYGVDFGAGDASDWIDYSEALDDDAAEAYLKAKKLRLPYESFPVLRRALDSVYESIKEEEESNMLSMDDEYTMECLGKCPVDPDDINDLVADRDPYTLEYFELTDLSEEELDEWDANYLDELPDVCDFEKDFEPSSPFNGGWSLNVEFADHPEEDDLLTEEAARTLTELLQEAADGDYSTVIDYVDRCESLYFEGELSELANALAAELGITGFEV